MAMKILWLSATPCNAVNYLKKENIVGGGWLISLESSLKKYTDIELNVAFYYPEEIEDFFFEGVHYFPIYDKNKANRLQRVYSRFNNKNDSKFHIDKILEIVNVVNPDLIHVHGSETDYGLILFHTNIPVIVSIQGILSPYLDKYYSGLTPSHFRHSDNLYNHLKGNTVSMKYKNMERRSLTEQRILSNAKYILGRTDWDKRITYLFNPKRQYYVCDEILRKPFYEIRWKKTKFNEIFKIVSTVSSQAPYKGGETLIKTATLLEKYCNFKFEWVVIGAGPNDVLMRASLCKAGLRHYPESIKFMGRQDANVIASILAQSDIYCSVSHIENSPNTVCEAMLVGMPVIASYAGGTPSILEDYKEGRLVQGGDSYSLASMIIGFREHFEMAKKYSQNAYDRACIRHDPKRISAELVKNYKSIIDQQ